MKDIIITDENNIDTTNRDGRLKFGLSKEKDFYKLLDDNGIIDMVKNNDDSLFEWRDYIYSDDNINIFIELKSRTCHKESYRNTLLAKNKVQSYISHKEANKKNYYFIVFCFLNGEYYFIQYLKNVFKTFKDDKLIFNKYHYEIPVDLLKPIDILYPILRNLINDSKNKI